ncbi:rhodanese-like domain-containing protein [Phocaeicola dorei]|nr:rhodanese-like domain-containing protein [Phocaeicola dorei]
MQLIDVRTVAEYSEAIYRAASISMYWTMSLAQTSRSFFKKTRPVAVYCKSGRRSRNAVNILVKKDSKCIIWIRVS